MKRTIRIASKGSPSVVVTATIDSSGESLTRDEVESIRDRLADNLMGALLDLPYSAHRISKMRVSK
jgi:hypothetical protein